MASIEIVERKPQSLNGYTLIEGFPGMGLVGPISVNYISDRLDFEMYGYIESDFFLPIVRVHKGLPRYPAAIFINKKLKLVAIMSEQIIPKNAVHLVAKEIVKWARKKGIKRIIALEGIRTPKKDKTEQIFGIACSKKAKTELEKFNVKMVSNGITSGVTSMILLNLRERESDIKAYSLLGNVVALEDYKAAAACINKLSEILKVKIDTGPLLKEARDTEAKILKQLKEIKETHEKVNKFEKGTHPLMYS